MAAYDVGIKRAREYLRLNSLETLATMTFQEFCALGKLDARHRYKREDAQSDYAAAWRAVGEAFAVLFKPSDNETIVAVAILGALHSTLRRACDYLERLREWEMPGSSIIMEHIEDVVASSIEDIGEIMERLRQTKEQG